MSKDEQAIHGLQKIIREINRYTCQRYAAEEKIRIALDEALDNLEKR